MKTNFTFKINFSLLKYLNFFLTEQYLDTTYHETKHLLKHCSKLSGANLTVINRNIIIIVWVIYWSFLKLFHNFINFFIFAPPTKR